MISIFHRVENFVWRGENAGYHKAIERLDCVVKDWTSFLEYSSFTNVSKADSNNAV